MNFPGTHRFPFPGPYFPNRPLANPVAGTLVGVVNGQQVLFGPIVLYSTGEPAGINVTALLADKDYFPRRTFISLWHPQLAGEQAQAEIDRFEFNASVLATELSEAERDSPPATVRAARARLAGWLMEYAEWLVARKARDAAGWVLAEAEALAPKPAAGDTPPTGLSAEPDEERWDDVTMEWSRDPLAGPPNKRPSM